MGNFNASDTLPVHFQLLFYCRPPVYRVIIQQHVTDADTHRRTFFQFPFMQGKDKGLVLPQNIIYGQCPVPDNRLKVLPVSCAPCQLYSFHTTQCLMVSSS